MKVLLLSPPVTLAKDKGYPLYPPIGLAAVAALLVEAGHEIEIVDCYVEGIKNVFSLGNCKRIGLSEKTIANRILAFGPALIGIGCNFTDFRADAFKLARVCKETLPGIPVILGGAHGTMYPKDSIENENVDVVVRGEGEKTMLEICERYSQGKSISNVAGTVVKQNGGIIFNPLRQLITNLDGLPMPSYRHLRMDLYLRNQKDIYPFARGKRVGFVVSSRGCPYNCIFCSSKQLGGKYREKTPTNVVNEIEFLVKKYSVNEIAFQDDCFNFNNKRVEMICDEIINRKLNVFLSFPVGLSVRNLTKEMVLKLKEAGTYRICFPIETGCLKTQTFIRKKINLEQLKELIAFSNGLGLWTYGNFIIGFPYETIEDIKGTMSYAFESDLDMISLYIAQPMYGTDMYKIYEKEGLLKEGTMNKVDNFNTRYDTVHFTAAQLNKMRESYLSDYLRMRICSIFTVRGMQKFVRKINSPKKLIYFIRVVLHLFRVTIRNKRLSYFFHSKSQT